MSTPATALPDEPLSPLDGRYRRVAQPLAAHLSEAGLNRARLRVEIEWLLLLTDERFAGVEPLSDTEADALRTLVTDFGPAEVAELAELEAVTRHDVKAVEYLLRRRLDEAGLGRVAELVHFACTSEDVNNLAYALVVSDALREVWLPAYDALTAQLRALALEHRALPMLAHTHGQPATPTTVGKEFAVFVHRLQRVRHRIGELEVTAKFSGATGTFSAHVAAAPELDWPALSQRFVTSLGLVWNPLTTQIESHDWQVELYQALAHGNRILHNLATDAWSYIQMGYFAQIPQAGATGSSTMPHKINPIRFENAEANLELSNALLDSLAATLATSRLQRDLTDSTTQRNIGVAFGHSLVAIDNLRRGLTEIELDGARLAADLEANQEVLGEAIQTVARAEIAGGRSSISDPYALLKELTRGRRVSHGDLVAFIDGLDLPVEAKSRLRALTPATYTGLADALVDHVDDPS